MRFASPRVALVTGATGYLGSELANHLARQRWRVHVIARPSSDLSLLQRQRMYANFVIHRYDGAYASLLAAVEKSQPDVVFHLASAVLNDQSADNIDLMLDANIRFGVHLAQAMLCTGVTKLVNTGTFWQHYNCAPYDPVNLYAATKQALESLLQFYVNAHGFQVVNLKLFDTYGESDPRPKLMNLLRKAAQNGAVLAMSPGKQKIDLVHVEDLARAYNVAATRLLEGNAPGIVSYGVSSGQSLTLRALVQLIEEITGTSLTIKWGERSYREREVMEPWVEDNLPNWSPQIDLKEGIQRVFL